MRDLIQIVPLLFLLAAGNNKDYVLAQNSDIYFPGRTNTNTNSVHNVVAELNRNNVMAFLNQPQQVNLPGPQANPFQSASNRPPQQQSSSNVNGQGFLPSSNQNTHSASLPSIIRPAPPVHQQNTLASVTSRPQSEVFFPIKQQQQHNLPTPTVSQVSWVQPNGASNTIGRPPSNSATSPLSQSGPFESGFQYAQGGQSSDPYVAFAIKLFENAYTGTQNLVLSPILTQASLALLQHGANGRTRDDISAVVQSPLGAITHLISSLKSINSQRTAIEYASTVYVGNDGQLNRTFARVANDAGSSVVPVNFRQPAQTVQIINSRVSQATRGAIPSILDQNSDTRSLQMLLVNAIYFKSDWKYEFQSTEQGQFYKAKASSKPVTFMKAKQHYPTGHIESSGRSGGAYWVEIPYAGDEFSMVILVPGFRDMLASLMTDLSTSHVQTILNQLGAPTRTLVDLKIPKFDVETRTSLVASLHNMGLASLFSSPSELVYINEGRRLTVSDCIHSAKLTVDERGTVAAAANAFSVVPLSISLPDPEVPFIVDQPFLALIVDKRNKYPLFMARIFDP